MAIGVLEIVVLAAVVGSFCVITWVAWPWAKRHPRLTSAALLCMVAAGGAVYALRDTSKRIHIVNNSDGPVLVEYAHAPTGDSSEDRKSALGTLEPGETRAIAVPPEPPYLRVYFRHTGEADAEADTALSPVQFYLPDFTTPIGGRYYLVIGRHGFHIEPTSLFHPMPSVP